MFGKQDLVPGGAWYLFSSPLFPGYASCHVDARDCFSGGGDKWLGHEAEHCFH